MTFKIEAACYHIHGHGACLRSADMGFISSQERTYTLCTGATRCLQLQGQALVSTFREYQLSDSLDEGLSVCRGWHSQDR